MSRLAAYEIGDRIGAGGCGCVYKAVRQADGLPVAIKIRTLGFAAIDGAARFQRECQILCDGRHARRKHRDYVVRGIEYFTEGGHDYLVMEFVDGPSLYQPQFRGLPIRKALLLTDAVLNGLEFLHGIDCIHRDIKPANLIYVGSDRRDHYKVKVVDLGLARVDDGLLVTKNGMGSYGYSAPECFLTPASATPASDLYGVAAVLFFMLTGDPPSFDLFPDPIKYHRDFQRLMTGSEAYSPPRLSELRPYTPLELSNLVSQSMSIAPSQRPQTVAEFRLALRPLVADLNKISRDRHIIDTLKSAMKKLVDEAKQDEKAKPLQENNAAEVSKRCADLLATIEREIGGEGSDWMSRWGRFSPPMDVSTPRRMFLECIQEMREIASRWSSAPTVTLIDFRQTVGTCEGVMRKCVAIDNHLLPVARLLG